jgi:hypothetical protein
MDLTHEQKDYFWSWVNKTDTCWLWTGSVTAYGYGRMRKQGKTLQAHRLSLEMALGRSLGKMMACHSCRNRLCVNPAHLREGTALDNQRDRIKDGTAPRGSNHGHAKLTEDQVRAIRADTRTQREIAEQYGVTMPNVSHIKTYKSWKHVSDI